jgi:ankyrin repeat protein
MPATRPDPIDDRTPLIRAPCADDLCELFDLILSGAPVDAQDSHGWTALNHACSHGNYEIAQQLLDSGANPNLHESYSMIETPLSLAAKCGHFDVVRLLIAHEADPNCYAGSMAIRAECYARREGHLGIAQFLRREEDKRARAGRKSV